MNLDLITSLQTDFGRLYDENFRLRNKEIYSKEIDSFRKRLEGAGISSKLSPKEIELKLQQTYELLMKVPKFADRSREEISRNEDLKAKTFRRDEIEALQEKADERARQKTEATKSSTKAFDDFVKAQKNIREQIVKAEAAQEQLKNKVVYAKVIIPDPLPLDDTEKQDLETLREFATNSEETRTKLIDDLAIKIESKLENIPVEQKEIIAKTAAVEIVEKLAKPEIAIGIQVQTAILTAVHEDKTQVLPKVLQKDDALLIAAKNGSVLLELENRNSEFFTKDVATKLFGPKLAREIFKSDKIQVVLSETRIEGQTKYQVNLGDLNQNQIQVLNHQSELLNSVQKFGVDKAGGVFTNYTRSYMAEKIASMPANSVIKKTYSSPITQSILARYGLANPVVWEAVGQSQFVGLAMKFAPETAGPLLSFAGKALGKEFVKPVAAKIAGQAIGKAVGTAVATTGAEAGAAAGAAVGGGILSVVTAAIGAAIGWAAGELLSKAKEWWTKNKDKAGPAIAMGLGFGGLVLGGPGVGGVAFGLGLAATGSLAAFAAGTFGVLGFIGRSVGIAIATPVIITLLVIPPLVAFIMLVINNSAYVVPPDAKSLGLNIDNPYILITKVASPDKIDNPTSGTTTVTYTVTIKALKSALSNLSITGATCKVSKKNASTILPCPNELENIPPLPADLTISPSSSYSFTFTSEFDSKYADTSVFDTIKIKGDSIEEAGIETSGSESVCIGDCPHGCFEISDNSEKWSSNPNAAQTLEGATLELTSKFPNFVDKVCSDKVAAGKKLNLCYTTKNPNPIGSGGRCINAIYAIHFDTDSCDITFNQCGISGSPGDALFLLTHELTHHAENVDGSIIDRFRSAGAQTSLCSYSGTNGDESESAAESMALYANGGTASFSTCSMNFISQYPRNYTFAKDYMNNP